MDVRAWCAVPTAITMEAASFPGGDMLLMPIVTAAVLADVPPTTPPVASPVVSAASQPAAVPARQIYSWRWTDGSKSTERTFRKAKYGTVDRIPKVEVRVYPVYPPWRAKLLFWVNGSWVTRQKVRTDPDGRLQLSFDPIGPTGKWEEVTWIVRIRLKDISASRSTAAAVPAQEGEIQLTVHYRN